MELKRTVKAQLAPLARVLLRQPLFRIDQGVLTEPPVPGLVMVTALPPLTTAWLAVIVTVTVVPELSATVPRVGLEEVVAATAEGAAAACAGATPLSSRPRMAALPATTRLRVARNCWNRIEVLPKSAMAQLGRESTSPNRAFP